MYRVRAAMVGLSMLGYGAPAAASPWTLPRGQLVLSSTFDIQYADSEFVRGGERLFPLDGEFLGAGLTLSGRFGVTDRIEVEASIPFRYVGFQADPVILRAAPPDLRGAEALAFYQANVVDFSQAGGGVGDIALRGRYQFLRGRLVSAFQLGLQFPGGYRGPEGTFGREPDTVEAFRARADELVRPGRVRDDVVLGDARVEIEPALLVGGSLSAGTFLRASLAYALRFGGAGDQVRASLKLGQALGRRVLVFASSRAEVTVEDGEVLGITVVAEDPEAPAEVFATGGLRFVVRPLERDLVDVGGGLVWKLSHDIEMNVSYARVVWGRFTAATHSAAVGFLFRSQP